MRGVNMDVAAGRMDIRSSVAVRVFVRDGRTTLLGGVYQSVYRIAITAGNRGVSMQQPLL